MAFPVARGSIDLCHAESFAKRVVALRAQYNVAELTGEREWTIIPAPVEPQRRPRERAALRGTISSGFRNFDYVAS